MKPLYTILDEVAGFYCPVFTAENDNHAIRMMKQSIDLEHRHDYTLFKVGMFNSDTGTLQELTPSLIMQGASLQKEKEK